MSPIVDPALTDPETVLGALDFAGVAVFAATAADVTHVVVDGRVVHRRDDEPEVGRLLAEAVAAVRARP